MRVLTVVFCCLLVVGLPSCNKENMDPGTIIRIEDDFNLTFWEGLSETRKDIQILVTTNTALDCENYIIDLSKDINSTAIKLRLNGVIAPENCEGLEGWPLDTVSLGNLTNKTYNFEVLIGGEITNIGQIDISSEQIITSFNETNGFSLSNDILNRIAPEFYWGTVSYTTGNESIATGFIDSLKLMAVSETLLQGSYGHFTINDSIVSIPAGSSGANVESFVFKIEEPETNVINLINRYRQDFSEEVIIEVWSGKGKQL